MKKIRFLSLVFVAAMLVGCEKDDGLSGTVEISIPGMGGNYNKPSVQMQNYGETGIRGVYATRFNIVVESSNDPADKLVIRIDVFHDSKSFAPGTYTFPSTGKGTATGSFFTSGSSGSDFSGTAVSGQVSIAVSGESYTITFNNVSMKLDDGTKIVSFVYKGTVKYVNFSETINPEYPGSSTIKETVSGATFPYMKMTANYLGFWQSFSSHGYSVYLTSMETNGFRLIVHIEFASATRDMKGLYLAPTRFFYGGIYHAGPVGEFCGKITLEHRGESLTKPIERGQVTIAESNGVYTITFFNVTDGGYGYEESMKVHGAYTGICSTFYDR